MRPANLLDYDVLLYRNQGWLGAGIAWGEWGGEDPGADMDYSHVALVYDVAKGLAFEMNPPSAHTFALDTVPWDRVDVYRLMLKGMPLFQQLTAVGSADSRLKKFLGPPPEPYDYGFIGKCLGADLAARVGLVGVATWLMQQNQMVQHQAVCSNTAEAVIEAGLWQVSPQSVLRPAGIGEDDMRPCDWPASPLVAKVAA